MKTFIMAAAIFLSVLNPTAYADEASKKVIAEDLLRTMKVDQMTKPMFVQMRSMIEQQFSQMGASEDMRPILKRYIDKIFNIVEQSLSWPVLKDDYISIYMQTYTETELKGMLTFYKSPIGQSVIDKMPMAVQQSMAIVQKHMPELNEKIDKISKEMVQEIKTEMEKNKKEKQDDERKT